MEWETIVNEHANANANKHNKRYTRRKKYVRRIIISAVLVIAFAMTVFCKLVHPFLGTVGMMIALMIAFYNLGRFKESA